MAKIANPAEEENAHAKSSKRTSEKILGEYQDLQYPEFRPSVGNIGITGSAIQSLRAEIS